jgi:hypothetical protein
MSLFELKEKFNILLKKFNRAEKWLDDKKVPLAKKEEWLNQGKMEVLTIELSSLMKEYKKLTGIEMTKDEVFEGF